MKTYNKKRLFLCLGIGLFLALCLLGIAFTNSFGKKSNKVFALELSEEVKEIYDLEEEFTMPTAQLSDGESTATATDSYIVFPDNTAKKGTDFVLNQAGLYSLVYSAEINGKVVKESKEFYVKDDLYKATSLNSIVEYQEETFLSKGQESGVKVGLLVNEQFTYSKPINLKTLGGDTPILRMYHENGTLLYEGVSSKEYVKYLYIRLTDCYDSNKYIEIRGRWNDNKMQLQAHQAHQPIAAQIVSPTTPGSKVFGTNDRLLDINGVQHWITYNTSWGCSAMRSDGLGWNFYFDYETKQLDVERGTTRKTIVDLDNSDIFDDKLFRDFTTGEVYLTVYGTNYQSGVEYCNMEFMEIAGEKLTENNVYIDEKGPEIEVEGYDGSRIKIAKDEPFEVLKANYVDANGVKDSKVSVFYNYGTSRQTEISVKNGKFTPKNIGEYVMIYRARDYFGAESVQEIRLESVACANNQSVSFAVDKLENVVAGGVYPLPAPTISSINGDTYCNVYFLNKNTGEKTLIEGEEFVPNGVGEFALVYEYGDKYVAKEYSYELSVAQSSNVIITTPALPTYIIANYFYSIDKATATSFNTGKAVTKDAKVYVKENDGEWSTNAVDLEQFKVSSTEVTKVRFKFVDETTGTAKESQDIKVVNVYENNRLAIQNYFEGDVTKAADDNYVTLTANATEGDVKVDYINSLTLTNFKLSLLIPEGYGNLEGVKITLTDYYDRNETKDFFLTKVSDKACRIYHGDGFIAVNKKIVGDTFTLSYADGKMLEEAGTGVECENDFTSERVLLSVTLVGVSGDAAVAIREISYQQMKNVAGDYVAPKIILNNKESGFVKMGETVKIYKAETMDVLSPYYKQNLKVTVFDSKSAIATSVDGVILRNAPADRDYELLLSAKGVYRVVYSYADQSGNTADLLTPYESVDGEAPTLSLSKIDEGDVVKGKVGKSVNLAAYKVSDDCDLEEEIKVIINVVSPSRENLYVKLGETTFKPDRAGLYTVKYMAMDKAGNYSTTYYYLMVQ